MLPARHVSFWAWLAFAVATGGVGPRPSSAQTSPAADSIELRIVVTGVSADLRRNVLAVLSIAPVARRRLTEARIRALHRRAPGEIQLALEPFGHYRATVQAELRTESRPWVAEYTIDPGPQVMVRSVTAALTGPGSEDVAIRGALAAFPLRAASPLRHDLYEQGKLAIMTAAADRGFLDAQFVTSEIRLTVQEQKADIVLAFETGRRFSFGPVTFSQAGVDSSILARYVPFERGAPFSGNSLMQLQRALTESPYFDRVEVEPRRTQATGDEVPIDVNLGVRRPRRYLVGAGFGTNSGVRGSLDIEWRRVNRLGHQAGLALVGSIAERRVTSSYVMPLAFPRPEVITLRGTYWDRTLITHTSESVRLGAGVLRARGRWEEGVALDYRRDAFTVGPDSAVSSLLVLGLSWQQIRTDDRIFPTRGFRLRGNIQGSVDRLFSDASFVRVTANAKVIASPTSRTRVITRIDVGGVHTGAFRQLPPTIRFFTGGDHSVRGYQFQSLTPTDDMNQPIGGRVLAVGSVELEQRFASHWGIGAFIDSGNALSGFSGALATGMGGGMRWLSPVGLVRVDVAWPIGRDPGPRLHVIIGPDL